jgi:CopG-like RHH_1 or ribbon-helix-helix domain, RHH_5
MPAGQHSSIRVALAVPPKIHEQLKAWADYEGRPVASLCMYLIENSLRAAQRDGIAPSFGNDVSTEERIGKWEGYRHSSTAPDATEEKRFTQMYEDKLAAKKKEERMKLVQSLLAAIEEP